MDELSGDTMRFEIDKPEAPLAQKVLFLVFQALEEKGYDPVSQIVGYLMSGDPTYITSHKDARKLIRRLERDELLEELVRSYQRRSK